MLEDLRVLRGEIAVSVCLSVIIGGGSVPVLREGINRNL